MLADRVVARTLGSLDAIGEADGPEDLAAGSKEHHPAVVATEAAPAHPGHLAERAELVEQPGLVARDPRRQDLALQDRRRDRDAGELVDDLGEPLEGAPVRSGTAAAPMGAMPCQAGRNRPSVSGSTGSTSCRSRASDRRRSIRRTSGSHHSRFGAAGPELAPQDRAGGEQPAERVVDDAERKDPSGARGIRGQGTGHGFGPSARGGLERPSRGVAERGSESRPGGATPTPSRYRATSSMATQRSWPRAGLHGAPA